jgi:2-keto-4-pentenoate hydratase/2-oxohepta-3-ene-1,7-dioic acid hydratase in catechol pathway
MHWIRYQLDDGQVGVGVVREDHVVPLSAPGFENTGSMREVIARYDELTRWLDQLAKHPVLDQRWRPLAPVDRPEKIICVGLNYRAHALETGKQPPREPVIFGKFPSALIGPEEPIALPPVSDQVDYEAELVVVIGRAGRRITEESALEHVFGYCCGHDVSSRDWQYHRSGGQWLLGKSFDTFAPLGPRIATRAAVADPHALQIRMHLNDEVVQDSNTSDLIFSIPFLISHLSQVCTLRPGDLIFTGTPSGVGAARNPQRFLQPGDRCTVEIENLGRLTNPVVLG